MALAARQLHRGLSNLRRAPMRQSSPLNSTRRHSSTSSQDFTLRFQSQLTEVLRDVSPSVVALLSYFSGPENQEIPHSTRRGTGFFVDPKLIVTSARVVGRVSTVYDPERSSVLHNCFLARTVAFNGYQEVFRTSPVAVNFAGDVVVLEVHNPRQTAPPLAVAKSIAGISSILLGIVRHGTCSAFTYRMPLHRSARENSGRPKAPWPLDDKLEWVDYGASENRDNVTVSLLNISGSPWFNLRKEVVGIASWAAEEADGRMNSYAVPPSFIRLMVDYAKTKGPDDPVVVDRWINEHTVPDSNADITEECVPHWPKNILMQWYTS